MTRLSAATVTVMIVTAISAVPAAADRHCAPVLDLYYQSRHEIIAAPDACPAGLSRAARRLEDSALAAQNCGCAGLQMRLQALLDRIQSENDDDGRSCKARSALVLEAADQLDNAYDKCL